MQVWCKLGELIEFLSYYYFLIIYKYCICKNASNIEIDFIIQLLFIVNISKVCKLISKKWQLLFNIFILVFVLLSLSGVNV